MVYSSSTSKNIFYSYKTMSITKCDWFKLCLLCFFSLYCFYTWLSTFHYLSFTWTTTQSPQSSKLKSMITPSYQFCDQIIQKIQSKSTKTKEELLNLSLQCHSDFQVAYKRGTNECNGYIQRVQTCLQSHEYRDSSCFAEYNNVDSCMNVILSQTKSSWEKNIS